MFLRFSVLIFAALLGASLSSCTTFSQLFSGKEKKIDASKINIPARPEDAMTGSEFLRSTLNLTSTGREQAILRELSKGNLPSFFRQLVPVELNHRFEGMVYKGVVYVSRDYLAIGSDDDYVRIPMTPLTAQKLADKFGFVLPTRKLVDEIYNQAEVKLAPRPLPAGPEMVSNGYYREHDSKIDAQLAEKDSSQLIAGHKKDIVLTKRLVKLPRRVAIYGWHRSAGNPIQPLSLVHGNTYADYSHGVRMIGSIMEVGPYKMYVRDVLNDRELSGLLSDEGAISQSRVALDEQLSFVTDQRAELGIR